MNYLTKTFIFVAIFSLLFFILNEVYSFNVEYEKAKAQSYENDELIFNNLVQAQEENLKILSDVLTLDENVKEAYRQNNPEIIKKYVTHIWEKAKEAKLVYEIHFFKPPAISFVNFSNFKSIGSDVSDVRTDIVWITNSFTPSFHPFMCKTYPGYRATVPIMDDDETILGGLSIGKKMDWIPDFIKKRTNHDAFLVYSKESTNVLISEYYDLFIKDKKIIGKYILGDQTKKIDVSLISGIDFTQKRQDVMIDNKKYLLNTYPIIDFNNETMAYLCTIDDLDSVTERFYKTMLNNLILILITSIIIFILARKNNREIISKISNIAKISDDIKKRDFKILHATSEPRIQAVDENNLDVLQNDIINMGLEIEKKYTNFELESANKAKLLLKQLYTDKLTTLPNRSALFRDLDIYTQTYVAILNIQAFKRINDAFGFESGNLILQQLTSHINRINEGKDFHAYRVGSDEFVILNYEKKLEEEFESHVKYLVEIIEKENFYFNENKESEVSINLYAGVSFAPENKLETASVALEMAKKKNKDYIVYSEDASVKIKQMNNIETIKKIKRALENDGILVYFQAIVNAKGVVGKYEALVRMKDEEKVLSPFFFLDLSQSTKYYQYITEQVILKTFDVFKDRDELFSINLLAQDIMNEDTVSLLYKKLEGVNDTSQVVFEIVESEDVYNVKEVTEFIIKVKSMGAKIAIDDFGTGFSNFSYIMKIRPDFLKIDGSIIKNIDKDVSAKNITKAIVTFAKELNIKTIAEYVYSKEVYEICKEIGVDEFQGYYFSEPIEYV